MLGAAACCCCCHGCYCHCCLCSGAVRVQLGGLNISSSTISENRAHRHGGAVYVGGEQGKATTNSSLVVFNTTFLRNTAEANGGGIMLQRRAHTNITNSTFSDCHAWSEGGALCTVMVAEHEDDKSKSEDLQTMLDVHHVFFEGKSAEDKLFVGPLFR